MAKMQRHICRERINSTAKRKQGVLTLCMRVSVGQAYKPHLGESPIKKAKCPDFGPHASWEVPRSNRLILIYIFFSVKA